MLSAGSFYLCPVYVYMYCVSLMLKFTVLQAMEADVKLWYFSYFYLGTELDISFKWSPEGTV